MTAAQQTLTYESGVPGALFAGERVLWEEHPRPLPLCRRLLTGSLAVICVITAIITGAITHGQPMAIVGSTAVVAAVWIVAAIFSTRSESTARARTENIFYRVTDRRIMRTNVKSRHDYEQVQIGELESLLVVHGNHPHINIGELEIADVPDVNVAVQRMLQAWRMSGRRRNLRRMPAVRRDDSQIDRTEQSLRPPSAVVLADDEKVLWLSRPLVTATVD